MESDNDITKSDSRAFDARCLERTLQASYILFKGGTSTGGTMGITGIMAAEEGILRCGEKRARMRV